MLLKILLCFLSCVSTTASVSLPKSRPPPLLLVSFDGFRADYLQQFPMPNLRRLYRQGVLVEQLTNVFVTKTFPNHYSLVTGLYAESHGIVSINMYNPVNHKHFSGSNHSDPSWWQEAMPLWISALDSGHTTAAMMWPGSDMPFGNRTATHFSTYDSHMSFRDRLDKITNWILGTEEEQGVMFAALYYEEPDRSGHIFGPDDKIAMGRALKEVDDNIGLLMSELERLGLWGSVNVVITSDHGMAQCDSSRLIRLDDCLHPDNYTLVDRTPVAALIPNGDVDAVFAKLNGCHPNMTAYLKKDIPVRLHYRDSILIQPVMLIADEGWTIILRGNKLPRLGDHGYDNSLPSMHPFLAGIGPSFHQGYRISSLQSVDVYPLMCHLLSVPQQPNNGTLVRARCLLSSESCNDMTSLVLLVMGVLLLLTTLIVMFHTAGRCHRTKAFKRWRKDDQETLVQ